MLISEPLLKGLRYQDVKMEEPTIILILHFRQRNNSMKENAKIFLFAIALVFGFLI